MKFAIACTKPVLDQNDEVLDVAEVFYVYDNETSEIWDEAGTPVDVDPLYKVNYGISKPTSPNNPLGKSRIKTLKIQLGLSCNYSCEYCSQRFVPNIEHANTKLLDKFLSSIDNWMQHPPEVVEFWGGEPFVYWKNLKPLAEALRTKWPLADFLVITNGSLITEDIIDWLDELNFSVGVSHDGPGQNVRGPDPLENPEQRNNLLKLFKRLLPKNKVSLNSMIHRENMDRNKIQEFFESILGKDSRFNIGEGGFIDVYDEGGLKNTLQSHAEHLGFRRLTLDALHDGQASRFNVVRQRLGEWVDSWGNKRSWDAIGQKCGMDREDNIAVDLNGNVLTCQNVTAVSKAPNGKSHRIGHVSQFDKIKLTTSTHWKFRDECAKCPVLQMCKGSCMFLEDEYFKKSCDSAYSDHIPFFAKAFEHVTGALPFAIKALDDNYRLPEEREDLWGSRGQQAIVPETRKDPISL